MSTPGGLSDLPMASTRVLVDSSRLVRRSSLTAALHRPSAIERPLRLTMASAPSMTEESISPAAGFHAASVDESSIERRTSTGYS